MDSTISRRNVLVAGATGAGALAGAAVLAACSPNSTGNSGGGPPASETPGHTLAALADVPVGGAKAVTLSDGSPAVVARPSAASAACFSAICTHENCTVRVSGKELDCPCHGSRFDALTGAVLNGPAGRPLDRIAVRVSGGKVVTA